MTTLMHVVAHQDDDLLFMNPDLATAIRSGDPSLTVFLTAGQKSGFGTTEGQRARSRQRGIQDAYAHMAGLTPTARQTEWIGDLVTIGGKLVERYRLAGSGVHVVFVALRDGQLADLYAGTPHLTVPAAGGLGAPQYGYNRADVVNLLTALIALYEPTEIRSLDPLPETRYWPAEHPDHTTSAKLVADTGTATPIRAYRGYDIGALPVNLAPDVAADKLTTFNIYAAYDPDAAATGWTERMLHRWPRGTSWVGHNADGRLQVFTVRAGRLWTWWQTVGGDWSAPLQLASAGGPLAPTVAVGHNADGAMEVLCRRLSDHRIVSIWQVAPNAGWSSTWADLGNPNAGSPLLGQVGAPTVARHADGRLCLFVKNAGGGVSMRSQNAPGASWGGWVDLGGTDVQDGLTALLNPAGHLEVFAATRERVLHWFQGVPGGAFIANPHLPSLVPAGPPTAVLGADGCIRVVYRRAGGSDVAVSVQGWPDGGWLPAVTGLGSGGTGQLAAMVSDGVVCLFGQDAGGGVSMTGLHWDGTPQEWSALAGATDCPAVAVDGDGAPVVFGGRIQPAYLSWPAESTWTEMP